MPMQCRLSRISIAILFFALFSVASHLEAAPAPMIMERYAIANGVQLHYLVAGKGSPVILLHGYAHNSHMWRALMKELAKTYLVVAPDLRGHGDSAQAEPRYDKKAMLQAVHAMAQ